MVTYTFQRVTTKRTISGQCPVCGRTVRRSRTFEMTVNPFNRGPDGAVRTAAEVRAAVNAKAMEWVPYFRHKTCKDDIEEDE